MIRIGASLLVLLLAACETQPEPAAAPQRSPAIARPTIELAGCRHVEPGRCTLEAGATGRLRVWIDVHARAPMRVTIDGLPIEPARVAVDGGQLLRIEVPERAERLRIDGAAPAWVAPFELRFDREQVPAVVAEANTLGRAGQVGAAIELLRNAELELEGVERLAVLQKLHRLLNGVEPNEALQRTEQAAELARALGRDRDFAVCALKITYITIRRGQLVRARHWMQQLERIAAELPEARAWASYFGGMLASRTGDLSASLRALHEAKRVAERLEMLPELQEIQEQRAMTLAQLGRADEATQVADELLARIEDPEVPCADRARALGNVAWMNLLLAEAGHRHDPPRPQLEQQLELVSSGGECPSSSSPVLVNLAIVALTEDEPEEALAWIRAQQLAGVPPDLQLWVDELEAQIGDATGRDELIPDLVRRPDPGGPELGLRWTAIVRHARTLEAFGMSAAAIDAYLEAEALLEDTFRMVGVDMGWELFLAGRRASAEELIELLLRQGKIDAAHCQARLARGRALRTVDRAARIAGLTPAQRAHREELLYGYLEIRDQLAHERREDWKFSQSEREHRERRRAERSNEAARLLDEALHLEGGGQAPSCDQLPTLAPEVVTITQFPRPDGGSWIFVADHEGTSVHAAPDPNVEAWSRELLAPFTKQIRAAKLIRILPSGSGWSVAFHALPFDDGVLLDVAPVVYSLDLPARDIDSLAAVGDAVVVANPSEDLPHAEREASEVVERLAAASWSVEQHVEARATRTQLNEALGRAALFHYAGHGSHGGVDGWEAALLLHDGDRIAVSDILALPRVPAAVVLSGCDTATVDHDTMAGGMNLSRAFVLAGARWVVAADGAIDDELARAMSVALYDSAVAREPFDGPTALRRAQLDLREHHPERWHAFRAVVP